MVHRLYPRAIATPWYVDAGWIGVDLRRLAWWLATFALVALATRALTALAFPDNERLQYQLTPCRLDAIAAGCAIALLVRAERFAAWWPRVRRWLGAVMIGAFV